MTLSSIARKILIIGPAWVGDMVMAQTLFKLLKHVNPQASIDVLAPAWTLSLLRRMPEVAHAWELPIGHKELKLATRYRIAKQLRPQGYDQAIVLPNSLKSAVIPFLARIPQRTGWLGEYRYIFLNDIRRLDKKRYPLMIERFMALGLPPNATLPRPYPLPTFSISKPSQQETLAKHHIPFSGKPVLAMCAGAEFGPAKRWLPDYFAKVANTKLQEGWDIWLFGSPKDRPVTEQIMAMTENRCVHIAGRTELAETIDLLSLITGMLTNDSGLMHVAAALKKPLIAVYGPTSPNFTPPLAEDATVLQLQLDCQPCFKRECPLKHHRCMQDITPEQVLEKMAQWSKNSCVSS